jgi:SAM-dependent methyltransferase
VTLKSFIPAPLVPPVKQLRDYIRSRFRRQPDYGRRFGDELARFSGIQNVHELPRITGYWAHRYVRPMFQQFGCENSAELFRNYMARSCNENPHSDVRFLSIGAGDSATEIGIARWLVDSGIRNFVFECLDINPEVLNRGRLAAAAHGLREKVTFSTFDLNAWHPPHQYRIILAMQSLHHIQELETLFERIKEVLHPAGYFVADDMIGRNGHRRWPEALRLVHQFWAELPEKYKYNHQLRRVEKQYVDWDCSVEGFEGIRSQDILPLLIRNFSFDTFVAFGNVIDPFVDRSFGPNFSPETDWDREFIDRVHAADADEIEAGRIKPTHMIAVMTKEQRNQTRIHKHMTPEFCVRRP